MNRTFHPFGSVVPVDEVRKQEPRIEVDLWFKRYFEERAAGKDHKEAGTIAEANAELLSRYNAAPHVRRNW